MRSSPSIHAFSRFCAFTLLVTTAVSVARAERDPIRLTHGPMLGNPTAHSMSVWGRTSDPGKFLVKYGLQATRLNHTSEPATTRIGHDNTGVALLQNLKSDTRYHYQVWVNGRPHGLPGAFRTLPSADDTRHEKYLSLIHI